MLNLFYKIKKSIIIISLILFFPVLGMCNHINFLPMEDAMSAARNAPELVNENVKPYRQSFNLGNKEVANRNYFDFTTSDICAFILLTGIYIILTRKDSKSRNASF